jgi:hypothetical protein
MQTTIKSIALAVALALTATAHASPDEYEFSSVDVVTTPQGTFVAGKILTADGRSANFGITPVHCVAGIGKLAVSTTEESGLVDVDLTVLGDPLNDVAAALCAAGMTPELTTVAESQVRKAKAKRVGRAILGAFAAYADGYNRGVNEARAAQSAGRMQTTCTTYGNTTTCR